jgi:hypothetical protein
MDENFKRSEAGGDDRQPFPKREDKGCPPPKKVQRAFPA